jgi:hypothetical protein
LCCPVGDAEVGAGDRDEAEYDRRCLTNLASVRPLHTLELGPAGAEKRNDAVALRARRLWGWNSALPKGLLRCRSVSTVPTTTTTGRNQLRRLRLRGAFAIALNLGLDRNAASAANERGVELVDIACMIERGR